ncbi:MAG: type II secretion system protein [Bacilli bacterium]|nr:type II secretion system protein [Bacilli bacterium]
MKKMSNKGFTLIELLAVITIMGILMLVAIPAVTRTIENSRRDTFADIANEYINAVRNAVLADNIVCYESGDWRVASANPDGTYIFPICTSSATCEDMAMAASGTKVLQKSDIQQSTTDLMESGGKSPFGSAEMRGYVRMVKSTSTVAATGDGDATNKTKVEYTIMLIDSGKHGIDVEKKTTELKRSAVKTATSTAAINEPASANPCKNAEGTTETCHPCKMS